MSDYLNFQSAKTGSRVDILNAHGATMYSAISDDGPVDVREYPVGVYLVKMVTGSSTTTFKVVKTPEA